MCTLFCVHPPRVGSLFPPILSKSCNQFPLGFKVWFSRNSSSRCRTPRLGSLMWGSEPSLQWVDFCGISVLQSVSHPPSSYGIRFCCDCTPPTVSLWLLLCLWMWCIFFGLFQCLPVNDCPAASCDSGVLASSMNSFIPYMWKKMKHTVKVWKKIYRKYLLWLFLGRSMVGGWKLVEGDFSFSFCIICSFQQSYIYKFIT